MSMTRTRGVLDATIFDGDWHGSGRVPRDRTPMMAPPTDNFPADAGAGQSRRYCLITPCRDEAEFARVTLDSVAAQTVRPTLWVIVDDGSTDRTPELLADFANQHDWVRVITRQDRGERKVGGGVVDAFYTGYDTIDPDDFDYVCKLDLDLELPEGYFEGLIEKMEANPRLATVSGKPYMRLHGRLVSELCGNENSVGMTKFYRTTAFQQIGGFVRQVMWDGIDGHRCRMLGWQAQSHDEPELRFVHLRPIGSSHRNWWTGRRRHGFGQYFMGTGLAYMTVSCLFRLFHPPMVVGSLAMFWGYVASMLAGVKRYDDRAFRAHLQRYQFACLIEGKRDATARFDAEGAERWQPATKAARSLVRA